LSRLECKKYCASKEPFDKAGAYGIQGYGSAFVKEVKGSYSNIVGLPIHEVAELFKKLNIPFWLN
jgi:septum formation protein